MTGQMVLICPFMPYNKDMKRLTINPVPRDIIAENHEDGMFYDDDRDYWQEDIIYALSLSEEMKLREATLDVHAMMLNAVAHILSTPRLREATGLSEHALHLAEQSFVRQEPSMYGRLDFIQDDKGDWRFMEYNADTPTGMIESVLIQHRFLKNNNQESIHHVFDALVERLTWLRERTGEDRPVLHLAALDESEMIDPETGDVYYSDPNMGEDINNARVVGRAAREAGWDTVEVLMNELYVDDNKLYDPDGQQIHHIYKIYPWEDLSEDANENGELLVTDELYDSVTSWLEPAWKMIASNKVLLVALWELYPNHPNLIYSSMTRGDLFNYVKKPIFGREGDGITIYAPSFNIKESYTEGRITPITRDEDYIYQEFIDTPSFDGNTTMIGSWVVGQELPDNPHAVMSSGFALRESNYRVTNGSARFASTIIERY